MSVDCLLVIDPAINQSRLPPNINEKDTRSSTRNSRLFICPKDLFSSLGSYFYVIFVTKSSRRPVLLFDPLANFVLAFFQNPPLRLLFQIHWVCSARAISYLRQQLCWCYCRGCFCHNFIHHKNLKNHARLRAPRSKCL